MFSTNKALNLKEWGSAFTLPKGSRLRLVKGADGLRGDLFAVADVALLVQLTGNSHDPRFRFVFIEAEHVEGETLEEKATVSRVQSKGVGR